MKTKHILAGFALMFSAAIATAHTGATGVMLERMQGMSAMADAMKALSPIVRGDAAHDAEAVANAARVLALHSVPDTVALFEEGTDQAPSEAAPAVWSNPDEFAALFAEMNALAVALETSAGSPEQTAALFGQIGGSCRDCHAVYRIKRD